MDALRKAAEQEQEPVAWRLKQKNGYWNTIDAKDLAAQPMWVRKLWEAAEPLYTHPPRREQDDAEIAKLRAEVERLRAALNVASGALLQCEPCMADECAQVQREWLDDARRLIDSALKEPK
jgi:hypothetical protein